MGTNKQEVTNRLAVKAGDHNKVEVKEKGEAEAEGAATTVAIPAKSVLYKGHLLPEKWGDLKYFKLSLELTIEAEGALLVGKGVGEAGVEGGKGIQIQPSGYDDGWKHAVAIKIDKKLGDYDLSIEDITPAATINSEGVNVSVELGLKAWGSDLKVKLTVIKVGSEWKKSKLAELEIDWSPPNPINVDKLPLGRDVAIKDLKVMPHIKGSAKPNWKNIALWIAKKFAIKVAEKVLEGAAETAVEDAVVEGGAEAATEALSEAEVEAAVEDAAGEAATEDLGMLVSAEVLVAGAAVLGSIYIMKKTFEDMAGGAWNADAGKKVDALTAVYVKGFRNGVFHQAEPKDEDEQVGYKAGVKRFTFLKGKLYQNFKEHYPKMSRKEADATIADTLRKEWEEDFFHAPPPDGSVRRTERGEAKVKCERTAQAKIYTAWAKEHDPSWRDRGSAWYSVFGHNPHDATRKEMEPWETELWEQLYGKEYS